MNKDKLGQNVIIGDYVAYAPGGSYSGISIGIIEKFTPKGLGIKQIKGGYGRQMGRSNLSRLYYTTLDSVIKLDSKLIGC